MLAGGLLTACASAPKTYFPGAAFAVDRADSTDSFDGAYYSIYYHRALTSMGEPSLYQQAQDHPDKTTYRMLFLMGGSAVHAIRVDVDSNGRADVTVRRLLSGYRKVRWKPLRETAQSTARSAQITALNAALVRTGFWNWTDRSALYDPASDNFALHPSFIILEAAKDGQYHYVNQGTATFDREMMSLARLFYDIGDIPEDADWALHEWLGISE